MLPIALGLANWSVVLAGAGRAVAQRLTLLDEANAAQVSVFAPFPEPELRAAAGGRLRERLPTSEDTIALAEVARRHRCLLNVEDDPAWCDFYMPSIVRRGGLVLSVSTGGASPALAVRIRTWLAERFGPEWAERLQEAARLRHALREAGSPPATVMAEIMALCDREGWLK